MCVSLLLFEGYLQAEQTIFFAPLFDSSAMSLLKRPHYVLRVNVRRMK